MASAEGGSALRQEPRRGPPAALPPHPLLDTSDPRVRAAIDESRHLFEQMGAGLWLARLDAALAHPATARASTEHALASQAPTPAASA